MQKSFPRLRLPFQIMYSLGAIYANQRFPSSLVDRIRIQNGSEKLDLSLCNISKIPLQVINDNFDGHPQHLDLSFNAIRYINNEFTWDMIHLTKLDLSRNQLKQLPDNFGEMQKLVYLDLHRNQLETLPISMGKMRHLSFLRISNNPFRSPLKDFLGQNEPGITAVALAGLVVQFLDEFATVHVPEISQSHKSIQCDKKRSSKVHYHGRNKGMGLSGNSSLSSTTSGGFGDTDYSNQNYCSTNPATTSLKTSTGLSTSISSLNLPKLVLSAIIVFVITSILLAYCVDATYLDYLAEKNTYFKEIWKAYKPYHETAALIAAWIPKSILTMVGRERLTKNKGFFVKVGSWLGMRT